jgi:cytochrome c biogenesis protein CcmG/thiol:disulfide interchange protein DsbE
MLPRRLAIRAAVSLIATMVGAVALSACGEDPGPASAVKSAATLDQQAGQVLGGGRAAFDRQLVALKGTPVVVNQWASWCGPCRFEFAFFQTLAKRYKGKVAFLGVDSQDSRSSASGFLKKHPVPYPSFHDPDTSVARSFRGGSAWPTTAFFDASGKRVNVHLGSYATVAKLDEDIRRYALGAGGV